MTVPAIVVGGWLGAGKTTLLNHLLREAGGRRLAVLVNDFGERVIDADLIDTAASQADVLALAGGCICCAFGADLLSTLQQVLARDPAPELVLIEASGVALPAAIARTARLASGLALEGTVVLADASTLAMQSRDPYVGETMRAQLQQADLLLLNQVDRSSAQALSDARALLAGLAPVIETVQARVTAELIFGLHPRADAAGRGPGVDLWSRGWRPHAAAAHYQSTLRRFEGPVDLPSLQAELAALPGLLRAKGFVRSADGQRWCLQAVGRRLDLRPMTAHEAGPPDDVLLVISLPAVDGDGGPALAP